MPKIHSGVICRDCSMLVRLDLASADWRTCLDDFVEDHYTEHGRFNFAIRVAV